MNKHQLNKMTEEAFSTTKEALRTMYDELNNGQQKKIFNNEKVAALLIHYEIIKGEEL